MKLRFVSFICLAAYLFPFGSIKAQLSEKFIVAPQSEGLKKGAISTFNCIYLGGETNSFGSGLEDFYIVKINSTGDTIWTRVVGTSTSDQLGSIKATLDGGSIAVGVTNSAGNLDLLLIKLDSSGNLQWNKRMGFPVTADFGYNVIENSDGSFFVSATCSSIQQGFCIIKLASTGNVLWSKSFNTLGVSTPRDLLVYAGKVYVIANALNDSALCVYSMDLNGNPISSSFYKAPGKFFSGSLSIDTTTLSLYLSGYYFNPNTVHQNTALIKIDSIGNIVWSQLYGNACFTRSFHMTQTSDNELVLVGDNYPGFGSFQSSIAVFDSSGTLLNEFIYGGTTADNAAFVGKLSNGKFIVGGETWQFGYSDLHFIFADSSWTINGCGLNTSNCGSTPLLNLQRIGNSLTNANIGIPVATQTLSFTNGGSLVVGCIPVEISEIEKDEPDIYPSPAKDLVYFNLPLINETCLVSIYNGLGKNLLRAERVGMENELDISHLPNGIYMAKLQIGNSERIYKFIINR